MCCGLWVLVVAVVVVDVVVVVVVLMVVVLIEICNANAWDDAIVRWAESKEGGQAVQLNWIELLSEKGSATTELKPTTTNPPLSALSAAFCKGAVFILSWGGLRWVYQQGDQWECFADASSIGGRLKNQEKGHAEKSQDRVRGSLGLSEAIKEHWKTVDSHQLCIMHGEWRWFVHRLRHVLKSFMDIQVLYPQTVVQAINTICVSWIRSVTHKLISNPS